MRQCHAAPGPRSLLALVASLAFSGCGGSAPGAASPGPPPAAPTPTPAPAREFLYVTSTPDWDRDLYSYEIDAGTGALTFLEARPFSGLMELAVHPSGRFLFRGHNESDGRSSADYALRTYSVAPNGALGDALLVSRFSTGAGAVTGVASSEGFLYVHSIDHPPDAILVWRIDPVSGALAASGGFAGGAPRAYGGAGLTSRFVVSPRGTSFHLTRGETLESYRIDASGVGRDVQKLQLPGSGGALAVRPDGLFLYVLSAVREGRGYTTRVSAFGLDEGGRPRAVSVALVADTATELTFDPRGRFLFVAREDGIDVYSVDPTTGLPTLAHQAAVGGWSSLAVEPGGRFLYVSRTDGGLWGYAIDPASGALRDLGRLGDGGGPMTTLARRAVD